MSAPTPVLVGYPGLGPQAVTSVVERPLGYDLTLACGCVVYSVIRLRRMYCTDCFRRDSARLLAETGGRP